MKSKRQEKILELIEKYDVETQEDLADLLKKPDLWQRRQPFHAISASFA